MRKLALLLSICLAVGIFAGAPPAFAAKTGAESSAPASSGTDGASSAPGDTSSAGGTSSAPSLADAPPIGGSSGTTGLPGAAGAAGSPTETTTLSPYSPGEQFTVKSKAVYLYNLETETVVSERNAQLPLQPASTAKIMTAVLALEHTSDLDAEFEYPDYIFNMLEPGVSQADVRRGEIMTMRKALYCLMLQSDCFSALAIADQVGDGDIDTFVSMMNEKAKEIGAVNTLFTNPHGLYDPEMYTTAYDMFLITKYARKVDGFMEIATTAYKDISPTNIPAHQTDYNLFTTIYPMLKSSDYYYAPIEGIKTGTLPEAGFNYVSSATKDGYTYILVLLGAPYADEFGTPLQEGAKVNFNPTFVDAKNLYEWAFNSFASKQLLEKGKTANGVAVRLSREADYVNLVAAESFSALVPKDIEVDAASGQGVVLVPHKPEYIDAPVSRGDRVGTVDIVLENMVLGTVDLLAEKSIDRSQTLLILDNIKQIFSSFWVKFAVVLLILILAFYITLMVLRNRYRKRYRRARGRRR